MASEITSQITSGIKYQQKEMGEQIEDEYRPQ